MAEPHLPEPGEDVGTWGYTLNEFLRVSHNENGTLKNGQVATAATIVESEGPFGVALMRRRMLSGSIQMNDPTPPLMAAPPMVSQSAAGAATNIVNPIVWDLGSNPALFTVLGAQLQKTSDPSYWIVTSVQPGNTSTFQPYAIEIQTDSAKFDISVRGNGAKFRLLVDGQLVSQNAYAISTTSGANVRIIVDFSGYKRLRTIRLEGDTLRLGAWTFSKTDILLPARRKYPRCIVMGDSIVEGSGAGGRYQSWPWLFGRALGWHDTWASGSGGTGYIADGSPSYTGRKKMRARLQSDVIAFSPDVVVLAAGRNDLSNAPASVTAEIVGCLDDLRATLPEAVLYVTSPLYLGNPGSSVITMNNAFKDAVASHPSGAVFIDLFNPVLFGGTGKSGSPKNDGPADTVISSDGVHPSPDGHTAIAHAVASQVSAHLAG